MRYYNLLFPLLVLFVLTGNPCHGQQVAAKGVAETAPRVIAGDSTIANPKKISKADTVAIKKLLWAPNPKKAGLYAALIPGLGQIYNRQYWKIPIVYVGLGVAGYFIVANTREYNTLRGAYIGRINNPNPTDEFVGIYSTEQLKQLQDDQNRTMNMTVLFSSLGYILQVLDAVTSAHLRNFDISRDISLRIKPVAMPYGNAGLGLAVNF